MILWYIQALIISTRKSVIWSYHKWISVNTSTWKTVISLVDMDYYDLCINTPPPPSYPHRILVRRQGSKPVFHNLCLGGAWKMITIIEINDHITFGSFSHVWTIILHAVIWYLITTRMIIDRQVSFVHHFDSKVSHMIISYCYKSRQIQPCFLFLIAIQIYHKPISLIRDGFGEKPCFFWCKIWCKISLYNDIVWRGRDVWWS